MATVTQLGSRLKWFAVVMALAVLSGCGGGGDNNTCVPDPNRNPLLPNCGTTPTPIGQSSITVSLTDAAGNPVNTVSATSSGIVRALVKDINGQPAPNIVVTFTTSDTTGRFNPASGTALTDCSGIARITILAGTAAGAFTVTATTSAVPAGTIVSTCGTVALGNVLAGSATVGYTVNVPNVPVTTITLALTDAAGNPINTISPTSPGIVQALVKDTNGQPAPNVAVTFTTSDATGRFNPASGTALTDCTGVARITVLAGTAAGAFTVTASTVATPSRTVISTCPGGTIVVSAITQSTANIGYTVNVPTPPPTALGSIKFVGADTTNIALKGTGGVGRQEFSTLTFQVFDQSGRPVPGTQVTFTLNTTVGGLSVLPQAALTDATGKVSTVVSAGTVPTPFVIVTASLPNTGITTVSSVLVVSTGLAVNARISISTTIGNFEGWEFDACPTDGGTVVSMSLDDHFGNPPPDGSAVSFTAAYGAIGASCLTGNVVVTPGQTTDSRVSGVSGACSVAYWSLGNRPPGGRAVVMGYLRGEEDFFDANGNNVCDNCGNTLGPEFKPANDLSPDIFRDDNETGRWDPGEQCIGPNTNGLCSTPPDGVYNGVLANPKIPDAQQTTYLGRSYVAIWSGSHPVITVTPASGICSTFSPPGSSGSVHIRIVDINGNPMPAGTTIVFSGPAIAPGSVTTFTVPNYVLGIGQHFGTGPNDVHIDEYDVPVLCTGSSSFFTIVVTTPRGIVTTQTVIVN